MLEYKKPDKRYSNPKVLYLMVTRFHNGVTETPVTEGYLKWLDKQGFNVPLEWKQERVAA